MSVYFIPLFLIHLIQTYWKINLKNQVFIVIIKNDNKKNIFADNMSDYHGHVTTEL